MCGEIVFSSKDALEKWVREEYAGGDVAVIPLKRYNSLELSERTLEALEGCGVDNWEGYSDAMLMLELGS